MSDDLISRSVLKNSLVKLNYWTENDYIETVCVIDEQPTAYDKDKVVEELEEIKEWYTTHGCNEDMNRGIISTTNRAIDIVRKGGVVDEQ